MFNALLPSIGQPTHQTPAVRLEIVLDDFLVEQDDLPRNVSLYNHNIFIGRKIMAVKNAVSRRYFSNFLASTICLPVLTGCASTPKPTKFVIDGANLKTIDDLVTAMKNAAGSSLPTAAQAKDFYKAIAEAFVQNIHAITDAGVKVPSEMLARLNKRNVVVPIMVEVILWGIKFYVPLHVIGQLVVNSLIVMALFVWGAIEAASGDGKKTTT